MLGKRDYVHGKEIIFLILEFVLKNSLIDINFNGFNHYFEKQFFFICFINFFQQNIFFLLLFNKVIIYICKNKFLQFFSNY